MSDLIDRQATIDMLDVGAEFLGRVLDCTDIVGAEREKYEWGLGLIESYISDMKELPAAQPDRKWIPCKERLPKKVGDYLVTTHNGQIARYIYMGNGTSKDYWMRCVAARMLLLEPYKEDNNEN